MLDQHEWVNEMVSFWGGSRTKDVVRRKERRRLFRQRERQKGPVGRWWGPATTQTTRLTRQNLIFQYSFGPLVRD